jgi:glycogen debranching enzyme
MNTPFPITAIVSVVFMASGAMAMDDAALAGAVLRDARLEAVKSRAVAIIQSGFNAGDGYSEVWIRDFNTFIELACDVRDPKEVRERLLLFFHFQGEDGNIVDGLTDAAKAGIGYEYQRAESQPDYVAHKNTVETDQESSLVQAVCRYARLTGDHTIFTEVVEGKSVTQRLDDALTFLAEKRFDKKHGLLWGGTTADWGDVQPEHEWGVNLDENSHLAIDIYDNALCLVAIDDLLAAGVLDTARADHWAAFRKMIAKNVRKHLWDAENEKFIPHVYLDGSPFPDDFNENEIYYHGGTAIAIQANLLSKEEVAKALEKMRANVKAVGAATIGLTMYPAYPEGFFKNPILTKPYTYQNGGDWTWFGARMIRELIRHGFVHEAMTELSPMLDRVIKNEGFYEWYSIDNKPRGSGTYRGSAGVLYAAITELETWARKHAAEESE